MTLEPGTIIQLKEFPQTNYEIMATLLGQVVLKRKTIDSLDPESIMIPVHELEELQQSINETNLEKEKATYRYLCIFLDKRGFSRFMMSNFNQSVTEFKEKISTFENITLNTPLQIIKVYCNNVTEYTLEEIKTTSKQLTPIQ